MLVRELIVRVVTHELVLVLKDGHVLEGDLVSQNAADTTETLAELHALLGAVGDEFEVGAELAVVFCEPLEERHGFLDLLHGLAGGAVHETRAVLLLLLGEHEDVLGAVRVLEHVAHHVEVLPHDECLDGTQVERFEGVVEAEAVLASLHGDLVKVLLDELLLLDELDVGERLCGELDGLVEAVLAAVGDVDDLDDLGLQTVVEHVGLAQLGLEVGGTGEDEAGDVALVVGDEVLRGELCDLAHVVVARLLTQTCETEGGLTTAAVLLWQVDRELLEDGAGVAGERAEEGAVAVHDDETELGVGLEELAERLCVELVVAEVERGVDGLEGLEGEVDLLLLALVCEDGAAVNHETVVGDAIVQLETLLCGGDGGEHRQTVDTRLDVGGCAVLLGEHVGSLGDLRSWWQDERDHRGACTASRIELLDELLDLPDLDVGLCGVGCGGHFESGWRWW
ncbi:hypothetical protein L1887_59786 [Cichorium endivia]|nr:hypothetical protein L1887_59786 [Cichorium endivia]